ncbi:hypothetical protein HO133_000584 [Letharia lupina]|uniref:Uncharacterized protein n=1 Tax=Letharia lupina TaxID=560253 RepID=A0A8H6CIG5_9LECA|nr:uncharacterized protein HO133_000584 [Letharia lupina]KAF6223741.1 hypothetical protein HO133_000584 [Letharia lupina]
MASAMLQARQAATMSKMPMSPPYPATTSALGGSPTINPDVPICAVFLLLYMIGAACHMAIFQTNQKRGHKFLISGMLFGFCMSRLVTTSLRIAWAVYPHNGRLAIAANIFVAAGVVLLFIINLLFAQRIVRSSHPNAGWHPIFHYSFVGLYVLIVVSLVALITSVIQQSYTLNLNTKRIDHDIQLYGQTLYAFVSFLPVLLVVGGLVIPRKTRVEKFGSGRFRHKIAILLLASCILSSGACFRAGVNYAGGKRPRADPAGYQSKACFYIFNFTVEIIVIYLYVIVRIDRRFFIPNNSHGPGDYSRTLKEAGSDKELASMEGMPIASEEQIFDDKRPEDPTRSNRETGKVVDEERGLSADEEIRQGQAPAAASNFGASFTPPTPLLTPPPASYQPREQGY